MPDVHAGAAPAPIRHLLDQLATSHLKPIDQPQQWNNFRVRYLDLRSLKLDLGSKVPFVWRDPPADPALLERELVTLSRSYAEQSIVVYLPLEAEAIKAVSPAVLRDHAIAIIPPETRAAILETGEHERRYQLLGSALARCVGVSALSPYRPGKPASGSRFFGRATFLRQIVPGRQIRNSSIVGNRRIGKTSLLHEVKDRLHQVFDPSKLRVVDIYSSKVMTTWDMVYLILDRLGVAVPKGWAKLGAIAPRYVTRFPQLVQDHARRQGVQVVLLFDEFDVFLERDATRKYEFAHLLRETVAEDGPCAVVLAGFRSLMQGRVRNDTPYYNFTQEVELTPLTKEETLDMIRIPLARVGIDLFGSDIPGLIHRETRGQPEMIQLYCQAVIALFERTGRIPLRNELAQYVNQEPVFNRTILQTFLANTNPLEQCLCLGLMQKAIVGHQDPVKFEFTVAEAEDTLRAYGRTLTNAERTSLVNNLTVGSIVEHVPGTPRMYRFVSPQLPRFCQAIGIEDLLSKAAAALEVPMETGAFLTVDPYKPDDE